MGYSRAGFEVVGVDIEPQPNYPFEFFQNDALRHMKRVLAGNERYDAIHASPPCQAFTQANGPWVGRLADDRHADLIEPTRALLKSSGLPYVIENVIGAPLIDPVMICGTSLGLNVRRHRLFECSFFPTLVPPCSGHERDYVICYGGGVRGRSHQIGRVGNGPIIRRSTLPLEVGREAMGIAWMDRLELSQAIPPAYTELIGHQLMAHVREAVPA